MSRVHEALQLSALGQNVHPSFELRHLIPALLRRKWLFAGIFLIVFLASGVYILTLPKTYQARMKLLVKNERQELVISPERNASSVRSVEPSESQVNSEIELLRSDDVLRRVVSLSGLGAPQPGSVQAAGGASPVSLDKALVGLQRDLSVSPVKKSVVIEVTYTAKDPQLTSAVLLNLRDVYLQAHLQIHGTPGSYAFFDQQARAYRQELKASEDQLKAFQEENSGLLLPNQDQGLSTHTMDSKAALEEADAKIADTKNRIARDTQLLTTLAPRVVTQLRSVPQAQLIGNLNQTLIELRNKRTGLRTKFRPDDRMVVEVERQISDTTAALEDALKATSTEQQTDVNPVRESAEKDLVNSQVALAGLEARRKSLASVVSEYNNKLLRLAGASIQHDQRLRKVKEIEENYLLYQKKREEARIAESLDMQRITNVAVIEAPVTPVQPSGPKVKRDLLLAGMCAVLLAFTSVVTLEAFTRHNGAVRRIELPSASVVG